MIELSGDSMVKPTERQQEFLDEFYRAHKERRPPPTIRELGKALGGVSINAVNDNVRALIRKGYLKAGPKGASRSTVLTDDGITRCILAKSERNSKDAS